MAARVERRRVLAAILCCLAFAAGADGDVLRINIGSARQDGTLRPLATAGDPIHVDFVCSAREEIEVEATFYADPNGDGVVQPNEVKQRPAFRARANARGMLRVRLGELRPETRRLIVRARSGTSVKAATLLVRPPREQPWWSRLDLFVDLPRTLRTPDESGGLCVWDVLRNELLLQVGRASGELTHPVLSHDEQRVAYVVRVDGRRHLVVSDLAGKPIDRPIEGGDWPAWLPDDAGVVYVRGGKAVAHLLGSNEDRDLGFDAEKILLASSDKPFTVIAVQDHAGADVPYRLTFALPSLSLQSMEELHFASDWERRLSPGGIYFAAIPKAGALSIVDGRTRRWIGVGSGWRVFDPSWSPRGGKLVFVCAPK